MYKLPLGHDDHLEPLPSFKEAPSSPNKECQALSPARTNRHHVLPERSIHTSVFGKAFRPSILRWAIRSPVRCVVHEELDSARQTNKGPHILLSRSLSAEQVVIISSILLDAFYSRFYTVSSSPKRNFSFQSPTMCASLLYSVNHSLI